MERQMSEAVTITNEELFDPLRYRGRTERKGGRKSGCRKRLVLDRLIANGFVQKANGQPVARYQTTAKTELLFSQLCIGISGGEDKQKPECRQP
jgi:hypothetical protein